jgi:hypothetical protein
VAKRPFASRPDGEVVSDAIDTMKRWRHDA